MLSACGSTWFIISSSSFCSFASFFTCPQWQRTIVYSPLDLPVKFPDARGKWCEKRCPSSFQLFLLNESQRRTARRSLVLPCGKGCDRIQNGLPTKVRYCHSFESLQTLLSFVFVVHRACSDTSSQSCRWTTEERILTSFMTYPMSVLNKSFKFFRKCRIVVR